MGWTIINGGFICEMRRLVARGGGVARGWGW